MQHFLSCRCVYFSVWSDRLELKRKIEEKTDIFICKIFKQSVQSTLKLMLSGAQSKYVQILPFPLFHSPIYFHPYFTISTNSTSCCHSVQSKVHPLQKSTMRSHISAEHKVHLGSEGPTLRAIKMAPGRGGFQVGGWPWNPNRKLLDLDSDIPGSLSIATGRS